MSVNKSKKAKIKNIVNPRDNLIQELDNYYGSKKQEVDLERLNSISTVSSAIIRTAKVQLEYAKYKGVNIDIKFLTDKP